MHLRQIHKFLFKPIPPYNFELTVKKPAGWHWFTPFEVWRGGAIWSGFWFRSSAKTKQKIPIGIRARGDGKLVSVDVYAPTSLNKQNLASLRGILVRALGVGEDIRSLYKVMRKSKILRSLVRRLYGMREGWASDIFPSLTLAILLQMAPIKRSEEMWDCLIRKYGSLIKFDKVAVRLWPTEETIAHRQPRELASVCKLGYRAKNLVRLAQQLSLGFPSAEELTKMSPEEAKNKLMELYGVGEYSAGFATPHPSFSLDVWSVKIFHQIIFGRPAPQKDPRSAIEKTNRAAEKLWGDWRGYVLVYVLNDLPYLSKRFNLKIN